MRLPALFVCGLVLASSIAAKADDDALKGLKSLKVDVVVGEDNVRGCNADRADIGRKAAAALQSAGVQPSDQATLLFTIEISSERRQGNCQFSYETYVHRTLKAMLPELGREVTGDFVLWEDDDDDLNAALSRFASTWKKVQ
jgi:hypothetical protein